MRAQRSYSSIVLGGLLGASLAGAAMAGDVETLHYVSDPYSAVTTFGVSTLPAFHLGSTIVGSITLAAPLAANMVDQAVTATAYDFKDGTMERSNTDAHPYTDFQFSTDATGRITDWFVLAINQPPLGSDFESDIFRIAYLDDGRSFNLHDASGEYICTDAVTCAPTADQTAVTQEHGTFTTSFAPSAPEPATWAMLITGFGLIGVARRRGRATGANTAAIA